MHDPRSTTLYSETNRFIAHTDAGEIVRWALGDAQRPVLSTNFRPQSIALIHLVQRLAPGIPVVWVDTGFNTEQTYRFVDHVVNRWQLELRVYTPRLSAARWHALNGDIPSLDSQAHRAFTEAVKLEPFRRAFDELEPDVWFTGIRAEQTEHRAQLGVISDGPADSRRIAPLFHWKRAAVEAYIAEHGLPDYDDYYDPTKGPAHRECGLQLMA